MTSSDRCKLGVGIVLPLQMQLVFDFNLVNL